MLKAEQTTSIERFLTYRPKIGEFGLSVEYSELEVGLSTKLSMYIATLMMETKGTLI